MHILTIEEARIVLVQLFKVINEPNVKYYNDRRKEWRRIKFSHLTEKQYKKAKAIIASLNGISDVSIDKVNYVNYNLGQINFGEIKFRTVHEFNFKVEMMMAAGEIDEQRGMEKLARNQMKIDQRAKKEKKQKKEKKLTYDALIAMHNSACRATSRARYIAAENIENMVNIVYDMEERIANLLQIIVELRDSGAKLNDRQEKVLRTFECLVADEFVKQQRDKKKNSKKKGSRKKK